MQVLLEDRRRDEMLPILDDVGDVVAVLGDTGRQLSDVKQSRQE
jgi:hypothetical protein